MMEGYRLAGGGLGANPAFLIFARHHDETPRRNYWLELYYAIGLQAPGSLAGVGGRAVRGESNFVV